MQQPDQRGHANAIRWVTLAAMMLSLAALFAWTPGAEAQATPTSQTAPGTVNVELILDSSGSMAGPVVEGEDLTRIDAAKQVLEDVIEAIPEREGINVGFRVYGHLGTNTEAGRAESCQSTELQVPIEGVNKEALREQVAAYEPVGWTPIALSLREAADDFPDAAEGVTNAVVLVTDGLETCGGDPCTASRALKQGDVGVTTHVIGFALLEEEQQNLQCIVDESGGLLLGAGSAEELRESLFQVLEEVEVVTRNGFLEIESIGGLFPKATIEGQAGATDTDPEGEPFATTLTDQNRIELPAGNYAVFWANPSGQETRIQVEIIAEETTFIRGSIIRFPHGAGEVYILRDQAGIVIWQDQIEEGDLVWVLPGIYRLDLEELTGDPVLISMVVQTHPGQVTKIDVMATP
ncbi:MAG: vWA domain-containing protein [Thermomicrobiales bacterium]